MILNTKIKNFTLSALLLLTTILSNPLFWANSLLGSAVISDVFFKTAEAETRSVDATKRIMIYGDSLSAAYGMDEENGWVALLARKLGPSHEVYNASISGETSSGGLARLPLTLKELFPDLVLLELGANDGLRGQSTDLLKSNLAAMIEAIQGSGAVAVLASVSLPPTYGPRYIDQFRAVYFDLAEEHEIPLLDLYQPSFVETPGYIQEDGLHPTEVTQPIIRDLVVEFLIDNALIELGSTPSH